MMRRLVGGMLVVVAAAASATVGASWLLWIGDYHGTGRPVRAVGAVLGAAAGVLVWRSLTRQRPELAAFVVAVAAGATVAAVPSGLAQTIHLTRLYAGMTSAQAARHGEPPVPPAGGGVDVFDVLRQSIPPHDTYVALGDMPFVVWGRYWLLPRIVAPSPARAQWVIARGAKPRGWSFSSLRRVAPDVWLGRVRP